jgi:hypothetical protein
MTIRLTIEISDLDPRVYTSSNLANEVCGLIASSDESSFNSNQIHCLEAFVVEE